jgi:hypothetical protein
MVKNKLLSSLSILALLLIGQCAALLAPLRAAWALLTGDTDQALEIAKGYDLLGNTVLNGEAGEYISTRANRARSEGRRWGCWLCRLMDWITADHCKNAE